jgi:DNA modification methylase
VERLLKKYSKENDRIFDPFMGNGTTIVESIVNNRIGVGTDINDIAYLTAKVKTTPIDSELLYIEVKNLILN